MKPKRKELNKNQWEQARALFERCQPLGTAARARLLDQETAGRRWLRNEVESLLGAGEPPDDFLGPTLLGKLVAPTPQAPPFQPEQLGKYRLLHPLGRGGMAEVFLAKTSWPQGFERLVAIKRILPAYSGDADLKRLFEAEAKLSSRLVHPNIVHLYDFENHQGTYLLAMEYVEGLNLDDFARLAGELPAEWAVFLMLGVADGLSYAHRGLRDTSTGENIPVIHRDITLRNLMVSFDGVVKIVDFGIARAQGQHAKTRTNQLRGTAQFLAPEVLTGKSGDGRSDVFSACAVLYELLAGRALFEGENVFAIMDAVRHARVGTRLKRLKVSAALRKVLEKGLAKDPADRFADAGEFREALAKLVKDPHAAQQAVAGFLRERCANEIAERERAVQVAETLWQAHRPRVFRRRALVAGLALTAAVLFSRPFLGPRRLLMSMTKPSAPRLPEVCREDARTLCPTFEIGRGLMLCLANDSHTSADCQVVVKSLSADSPCFRTALHLCGGRQGADFASCLSAHDSEIASQCQDGPAPNLSK